MTARDPDLQAAVDRAVTRVATAMRPIASIDPTTIARQAIEDLYAGPDHWRPWPGRDRIPDPAEGDPPNDEFKTRLRRLKGEPDA